MFLSAYSLPLHLCKTGICLGTNRSYLERVSMGRFFFLTYVQTGPRTSILLPLMNANGIYMFTMLCNMSTNGTLYLFLCLSCVKSLKSYSRDFVCLSRVNTLLLILLISTGFPLKYFSVHLNGIQTGLRSSILRE